MKLNQFEEERFRNQLIWLQIYAEAQRPVLEALNFINRRYARCQIRPKRRVRLTWFRRQKEKRDGQV